eukprot:119271-Amorphochlora_amoeboformis.AAC.1
MYVRKYIHTKQNIPISNPSITNPSSTPRNSQNPNISHQTRTIPRIQLNRTTTRRRGHRAGRRGETVDRGGRRGGGGGDGCGEGEYGRGVGGMKRKRTM